MQQAKLRLLLQKLAFVDRIDQIIQMGNHIVKAVIDKRDFPNRCGFGQGDRQISLLHLFHTGNHRFNGLGHRTGKADNHNDAESDD